jgi:hypothetical protein
MSGQLQWFVENVLAPRFLRRGRAQGGAAPDVPSFSQRPFYPMLL